MLKYTLIVQLLNPRKQMQKTKSLHIMASIVFLLMGFAFLFFDDLLTKIIGYLNIFAALFIIFLLLKFKDKVASWIITKQLRIIESFLFLSISLVFFNQGKPFQAFVMLFCSMAYLFLIYFEKRTLNKGLVEIYDENIKISGIFKTIRF